MKKKIENDFEKWLLDNGVSNKIIYHQRFTDFGILKNLLYLGGINLINSADLIPSYEIKENTFIINFVYNKSIINSFTFSVNGKGELSLEAIVERTIDDSPNTYFVRDKKLTYVDVKYMEDNLMINKRDTYMNYDNKRILRSNERRVYDATGIEIYYRILEKEDLPVSSKGSSSVVVDYFDAETLFEEKYQETDVKKMNEDSYTENEYDLKEEVTRVQFDVAYVNCEYFRTVFGEKRFFYNGMVPLKKECLSELRIPDRHFPNEMNYYKKPVIYPLDEEQILSIILDTRVGDEQRKSLLQWAKNANRTSFSYVHPSIAIKFDDVSLKLSKQ